MAETLAKSVIGQDAEKAQEKKRRLEPAPEHVKELVDESVLFPGLSGVSAKKPAIEGHSALLSDSRFSHTANNTQKARLVAELQGAYGNQYVQRLVDLTKVQAKLTVGSPNDRYEREADRVAYVITRAPACGVQRQAKEEEEEPEEGVPIQAKPEDNAQSWRQAEEEDSLQTQRSSPSTAVAIPDVESSINSLRGGGKPLPESIRDYFEPRFSADFSQVRVHADNRAHEAAESVNAKAFTTGKDVVFGKGQYCPDTEAGKKLLAHELTHVIQQSQNAVLPKSDSIKDRDRFATLKSGINRQIRSNTSYIQRQQRQICRNVLINYLIYTIMNDCLGTGIWGPQVMRSPGSLEIQNYDPRKHKIEILYKSSEVSISPNIPVSIKANGNGNIKVRLNTNVNQARITVVLRTGTSAGWCGSNRRHVWICP